MECRAEINRFAVFLLCFLVPLGSMAPTETSESKGQRLNHFTTEIPTLALVIQQKAHELFEFYNKCISATFHPEPWRVMSTARVMADRIPQCPAFQASCCALHHIHNTLRTLEGAIETFCAQSSRSVLEANLNQLNTTLSQGTAFYTCTSQDPSQSPPQGQPMSMADKKTYIWWVLKKYKDIMESTGNVYSEAAV